MEKTLSNVTGTGTKIEKVTDNEMKLCPYYCQDCQRMDKYCEENEPEYIKEFAGEVVRTDRCCDENDCFCGCRYTCGTWESKEKAIMKRGYRDCMKISTTPPETNNGTKLKKQWKPRRFAKIYCGTKRKEMHCEKIEKSFMCMTKIQYVPRQNMALICYNTKCLSKDEKKVITISAQSEVNHPEDMNNDGSTCINRGRKVDVRGKSGINEHRTTQKGFRRLGIADFQKKESRTNKKHLEQGKHTKHKEHGKHKNHKKYKKHIEIITSEEPIIEFTFDKVF